MTVCENRGGKSIKATRKTLSRSIFFTFPERNLFLRKIKCFLILWKNRHRKNIAHNENPQTSIKFRQNKPKKNLTIDTIGKTTRENSLQPFFTRRIRKEKWNSHRHCVFMSCLHYRLRSGNDEAQKLSAATLYEA